MHFAYFHLESLSYQLDKPVAQLFKAGIWKQFSFQYGPDSCLTLEKGSYHEISVPDLNPYVFGPLGSGSGLGFVITCTDPGPR
jgi:hypothetical protein